MGRGVSGAGVRRWSTRPARPALGPEAVRAWLEASCAAQGIGVKLTDPAVLTKVAVLLGAGREPVGRSSPPSDRDAAGVEAGVALVGGADGDAVGQGFDDGPLTGQGQAGPLAS